MNMGTGAPQQPSTTETPAAPAGAPPAAAAPAAPPAAPTTPSVVAPIERTPTRKILSADDDSLPEADAFEISPSAFKKRLERHGKAQLKQLFGTDNVEEIMEMKRQNEEFKAKQEADRLAQMTESERYRTQMEQEKANAAHWKTQYETYVETQALREQDQQMTKLASAYVNPKCMNYMMMEFATHLQGVEESEIGEPAAYADAWFKSYITANPEFGLQQPQTQVDPEAQARAAAAGAAAQQAVQGAPQGTPPKPVTQMLNNGINPTANRPPNATPTNAQGKTLAKGFPNSMTDAEAREYMRANGYTF